MAEYDQAQEQGQEHQETMTLSSPVSVVVHIAPSQTQEAEAAYRTSVQLVANGSDPHYKSRQSVTQTLSNLALLYVRSMPQTPPSQGS